MIRFDAIISLDRAQRIVMFNAAAERMFHCRAQDARGHPFERFIAAPSRMAYTDVMVGARAAAADIADGALHGFTGVRENGEEFALEASVAHAESDGQQIVTLILRDISRRSAAESRRERLNRLYSALIHINRAALGMLTRDELFERVCTVLVEQGGLRLAWIACPDPRHHALRPVAQCGDTDGFMAVVGTDPYGPLHVHEPSSAAVEQQLSYISNDLLNDAMPRLPWRSAAAALGFRASAAFPVWMNGEPIATLTVIANETGFFRHQEVAILAEASLMVGSSLAALARDQERLEAAQAVDRERMFVTQIFESVPGILYLYGRDGRFRRWNRNFERVTGYSADEVRQMQPQDFFSDEVQPLVNARVAEVFEHGTSSLEASFVDKDGVSRPYFFTGSRILFDGCECLVGMGVDISERKRAETALQESEQRFNAFMDATPAIAWITDEHGRHLYMNRAWDDAFGLDRREWIGKTAFDLVPADAAERIRQSDEALLRLDRPIEILDDTGILRGKRFYWNCFKFPFRNAAGQRLIGGIAIDMTERRLLEEERTRLAEQERRARVEADSASRQVDHILESVTDAFISLDREWRYVYVNDRAARIFNRRREDLLGKHIWTEFPEGVGQPFHRAYERAMVEQIPMQFEEYSAPSDQWFENRVYPTQGGISVVFQDITLRKRAERLLREANEVLEQKVSERTAELKAALVRAEAADRLKSTFLATMSHELRTPLNSILGFTGIILQGLAGPLTDEQFKQLTMVRNSARHLLELIRDVLDISKIEAGQLDVRAEPIDLRASVEHVVLAVTPILEKKGLTLSVALPSTVPPMVSDRRRLEQILLNLLNNAIKFTDRGTVTLAVEMCHHAPAPSGLPTPAVCIRVADTGIGIKADDLATLFQPFRQIDTGLARVHEGTGLGLAISRRLTELLGGTIAVESVWTKGSAFSVTLPLSGRK